MSIKAKGANCLSRQIRLTVYQGKGDVYQDNGTTVYQGARV